MLCTVKWGMNPPLGPLETSSTSRSKGAGHIRFSSGKILVINLQRHLSPLVIPPWVAVWRARSDFGFASSTRVHLHRLCAQPRSWWVFTLMCYSCCTCRHWSVCTGCTPHFGSNYTFTQHNRHGPLFSSNSSRPYWAANNCCHHSVLVRRQKHQQDQKAGP